MMTLPGSGVTHKRHTFGLAITGHPSVSGFVLYLRDLRVTDAHLVPASSHSLTHSLIYVMRVGVTQSFYPSLVDSVAS